MNRKKTRGLGKKNSGMTRRDFIASSFAGVLGAACGLNILSSAGCGRNWKDYNVLFVSLDTLRADSCGFMGYGRRTTPFLNEFSKGAAVFESMYTHSPWTDQSHATIFSSLYPRVHSITFHFKNYLRFSAASILKKYGYKTAGFVESISLDSRIGIATGFDEYYNQSDPGNIQNNRASDNNRRVFDWIKKNGEKKFFAFVHYFDIHYPYDPPGNYRNLFHKDEYEGGVNRIGKNLDFIRPSPPLEQIRQAKALYDGEIAFTDDQARRLISLLEDYKILDRTLVVIFSDHGEGFGEHRLYAHGNSLYQELLHIPAMMRVPGREFAGRRIKGVTRTIDILPTVLDYLEADTEEALQGVSLIPEIKSGAERDLLFFSDGIRYASCLRSGDWKLINNYIMNDEVIKLIGGRKPEYELYNLKDDPAESRILTGDNPGKVSELKELIRQFWVINKKWKKGFVMGRSQEIDEDVLKGLRQLGYIK
jgi:arylsulfatase A-like enzyme